MGRQLDQEVRRLVIARSRGYCEDCNEELSPDSTHVHHRTYERLGRELPKDLEVLCLRCHERRHPHQRFDSLRVQGQKAAWRRDLKRRGTTEAQENARRALKNAERRFKPPRTS